MKYILNFINLIFDKKFTTLAGAISFFLLINGGTALLLLLKLFNLLNISIKFNYSFLPEEVVRVLIYFINNATFTKGYSVFFLITSIWGASSLFVQLIQAGELIYGKKRTQKGLIKRLIAIIILITFIFLSIGGFSLLSIATRFINFIQYGFVSIFTKNLISFLLPFILVLFINVWIPPVKLSINKAIPGTLFTNIYWLLATVFYNFYLKNFCNLTQIYGAIAFLLIFILWLFIMTNGLIIGIIINYYIHKMYLIRKNNKDTILLNTRGD